VFLARDYVHLARYELERTGGHLTDRARKYLERAVAIHRAHFASPKDPLHGYSLPLYQSALELLGVGFDLGYFLAVSGERLPEGTPQLIQRRRFLDQTEAHAFLAHQLAALLEEAEQE